MLEPILKPILKTQAQQKNKKKTLFGTPFPRISGIQIMPRQKVNERGKKAFLTGIILYKRKGGIRPSKGSMRPYKGLIRLYKALIRPALSAYFAT